MVADLEEIIRLDCSLAAAAAGIRRFFRSTGNDDGDTIAVDLRLDTDGPGAVAVAVDVRSVVVSLQERRSSTDTAPRYLLQWAPATPGPLPLFTGELSVEGAPGTRDVALVLRGKINATLGGSDVAREAKSRRVARATANDLLAHIGAFIGSDA